MRKLLPGTLLLVVLVLSMGLLLAACGETDTATPNPNSTTIATTDTGGGTAGVNNSTAGSITGSITSAVSIKRLILSRDNTTKDTTTSFSPKDSSFYCIVELNQAVSNVSFKFVWTVVDAGGVQNSKFLENPIAAKASETYYTGIAQLGKDWPTGKYRVDFYANDTLSKSLDFMVQ